MPRATTRTLLPIDRWAAILGINPLHWAQVTSDFMPQTSCAKVYKQFDWQESDAIGREAIAQAIDEAERMIAREVGYTLLPTWQIDERVNTVQPAMLDLINTGGRDVQGFRQSVQTRWGQYISGGIEAKTLIDADAAVVYTDQDGDGYFETATVTVATTVTEPCEIAVYFPAESGADEWEVRPLRSVTITGGVATIVMYRQQLVLPELWEAFNPTAVDGDDNANFLTEVDVYRHWNDPQQQVQLLWSPLDGYCGCGGDSCTDCTLSTQYGCLTAKSYRLGIVTYHPATWDADDDEFVSASYAESRNPDRLRLWYYAGLQDTKRTCPTLQMDPSWERAVTYLSLMFLDREVCGCSNLQSLTQHWREELNYDSSSQAASARYQLAERVLGNPFGMTRGAILAWNLARETKLGRSVKL